VFINSVQESEAANICCQNTKTTALLKLCLDLKKSRNIADHEGDNELFAAAAEEEKDFK
jgi:hypothetical protein